MSERFNELDAEALYMPHGTVDGREAPRGTDGLCIPKYHGGSCRKCEAERKLRKLGFIRDSRSQISRLLHELADLL